MLIRTATLACIVGAIALLNLAESYEPDVKPRQSGLQPVSNAGPCNPPFDQSAAVGLRGYHRYHANDSLIGKPIPCTYDEKVCFQYNLLFDPDTDKCQPVGGGGPHGCDLRPNWQEFEQGSGRVFGVCKTYEDPCPGYRMAYDNRCYRKEVVRDIICGCEAQLTHHILGGVECRTAPPQPIYVQQPKEDGQCHLPDLRFPDSERSAFYENSLVHIQGFRGDLSSISFRDESPYLSCTEIQAKCFSQGTVWVPEHKKCVPLLERGPCSENLIVAMDVQAALGGRAEAVCVHVRGGCPPGRKRMAFDGQCHEDRSVEISAPTQIVKNQYGQYVLIPIGFAVRFHPQTVSSDTCVVTVQGVVTGGPYMAFPKPPCGANNKDDCLLYEVENGPPPPEVD